MSVTKIIMKPRKQIIRTPIKSANQENVAATLLLLLFADLMPITPIDKRMIDINNETIMGILYI